MGVVGVFLSYGNLRYSSKDIEALKVMNGKNLGLYRMMSVIAYGHYRNDLFRFSKTLTITLIGVIAMILPPQIRSQPVTPVGLVVTGGLFTIIVLIVMASALDRRQRDAIEQIQNSNDGGK